MKFILKYFQRANVVIFILCLFFQPNESKAGYGTTTGSGNWNSASTWLIDGANRAPTCGDTIFILSNDTVTVNSQVNLAACSSSLIIVVDSAAVFQFTNGNKLDLPCGSIVQLMNGGTLKKATSGGGNSTLISICSNTVWNAGDGPYTGPLALGGSGLPVSWLSVEATIKNRSVLVSWSTAEEINNNYFTLEKSTDGIIFNAIGIVTGAGNSTIVHSYQLVDNAPFNGISYYRIMQTDYDGKNAYSRLVAVNFNPDDENDIKFFPNPSGGNLYIAIPPSHDDIYMLHVFDMKGSEALKPVAAFSQRNNLFNLDMSTLANGVYTIMLVSEQDVRWGRLVKE